MAGSYIAAVGAGPKDIAAREGIGSGAGALARFGAGADGMAGALVEIWLTVSALSSLVIIMMALGHSDMRREKRLRPRVIPRRRARHTSP
ncbi:hypothetical protein V3I01_14230 [Sphingomonas sp. gentR]|jgi:hypothetical protein|uniref:hypothetical protein n=1 Tax=unclassified Sphingomonas TaxID=196159 RepID=UPI00097298B9|nr:hypothetical protein [Sphingomonas sp. LK11]APX67190.1 hypothetical protein AV944_16630 [Sphingomonas sp. LK11]